MLGTEPWVSFLLNSAAQLVGITERADHTALATWQMLSRAERRKAGTALRALSAPRDELHKEQREVCLQAGPGDAPALQAEDLPGGA